MVIRMLGGLARQLQGLLDEWVQALSHRLQPDVTKLVHQHTKVESGGQLCVCVICWCDLPPTDSFKFSF